MSEIKGAMESIRDSLQLNERQQNERLKARQSRNNEGIVVLGGGSFLIGGPSAGDKRHQSIDEQPYK